MIIMVHISFKCQFLLQKHHNMMDIGWLIQKEVQSPHWIILWYYVMYKMQFGNKIDVILIQNRSSKCKACTNKCRHVAIKQEFPWVSDHDSDDSSPSSSSSSSSSSPSGCVPGDTESVSGWWQKREIRSQAPRVPSPIISLQLGTNQRHCTIQLHNMYNSTNAMNIAHNRIYNVRFNTISKSAYIYICSYNER